MKKVYLVVFIIMMVIGVYACVRCAIDPNWYFGKSFVPDNVDIDEFWSYITGGIK